MSKMFGFDNVDKNAGGGEASVTIKGTMQDAQDAQRKVMDLVGSQRSYDNRGLQHGSDGHNRGSNNFDGNRGSHRSDGNRDYNSQSHQRNPFTGSSSTTNDRSDAYSNNTQQNNAMEAEPMEFEMIDWQAAARESVSLWPQLYNYELKCSFCFFSFSSSTFVGRTKSQTLGCLASIAKELLQGASGCNKHAIGKG